MVGKKRIRKKERNQEKVVEVEDLKRGLEEREVWVGTTTKWVFRPRSDYKK